MDYAQLIDDLYMELTILDVDEADLCHKYQISKDKSVRDRLKVIYEKMARVKSIIKKAELRIKK